MQPSGPCLHSSISYSKGWPALDSENHVTYAYVGVVGQHNIGGNNEVLD